MMLTGKVLLQGLLQRGFNQAQAAALVGNMKQESEFRPGVVNPGEGAQGLIQWRLGRLTGLKNFAAQNGQDYTDPNAQMDFIVHEMQGPEAKSARAFLQAKDVGSANAALKSYIRYGDNTEPVRLQNAMAYAGGGNDNAALGAVNNLAGGEPIVPNHLVQSVNYVPPPNSGQAGNFAPLPAFQDAQQPAQQQSAPVERAPLPDATAAPQNDVLTQWGVDAGTPAPSQDTPAAPEQDILHAWGVDGVADAPAGDLAKSQGAAPAATFGQAVGGAIDKGLDVAGKVVSPVFDMGNNLIRQAGTGVPIIGGLLNQADAATNALIAPAINPMLSTSNQLQGDTFGERYQNSLAEQNAKDAGFQSDHPVLATGAQLAGGIGALGGLSAAVPAIGTGLGVTGNLLTRTVAGTVSGGVLGGADAGIRSGGDPEAVKQGATLGAGLGLVTPAAGKIIGAGINKLVGGQIPERVAQLAQLARDKFGINVGPGQLSTNPTIRFLDSVVNRLPMSGGTAAKEVQQQAFNSAITKSFGETGSSVTPEVIDAAKGRIGKVFDSVAARTPAIQADGQFATDLKSIIGDAGQTLQDAEYAPLQKQMAEILGKFKAGNNAIDGETYQALTRKGAPLDRAIQSTDPNVSFYAGKIREALDGTLERSAPAEALADLRTARSQWKALKTIEPLATKSATGDISPALLMTQAAKSYGNSAVGKGADLVDLARVGQQFLKEAPSSGTAERSMLGNMLLGGAGGGGALGIAGLAANPGAIPFALGGALASGVVTRGIGTALRSPYLANKMIQSGLGTAARDGNLLLRSAPQGSLPQGNRKPLELTVNKPSG